MAVVSVYSLWQGHGLAGGRRRRQKHIDSEACRNADRGEPMPFTDGEGAEPVNVIYQSTEDDADDTIVPRFIAAGGDTDRLLFINEKEQYPSLRKLSV